MPLRPGVFDFPELDRRTFNGLPGLLADSLPDRFGNALIDRWLAEQGRTRAEMSPVERLLYVGARGMGALEFEPSEDQIAEGADSISLDALVRVANQVLLERKALSGSIKGGQADSNALTALLKVGTSAGGARAKAVLAWNEKSGEFRSGQLAAPDGYAHWLLKFDGVTESGDHGLADPQGFTRLEYACHLLAVEAGVTMSRCRLHEEGGRAHFMTRRFDRRADGGKVHMLSLGALRHFDFNQPQAYSYEQAVDTVRMLGLDLKAREEIVRRAIVNVVIRNQDDHVKNIAFLMEKTGKWALAPAYDVVYAYNPQGQWTSKHQMTLAGKASDFSREDLRRLGRHADLKPSRTDELIDAAVAAARHWDRHAESAGVPDGLAERAKAGFRFLD